MTATTETVNTDDGDRVGTSSTPRRWQWTVLHVGIVAVVASPIVVGALSLIGDTWFPAGDWAAMVHRVSQVGTSDTPLVGPYSVHGWAHPGPLGFWLTAPLYKLTGGDPRSLLWTAAAVNALCVVAVGLVAWRRGRWALLLGMMAWVAVLVRGIEAGLLVDPWNPYLGLLPFALTVLLVWDAAQGRRWSLVAAVVSASLAMHVHFAFVPLVGLVVAWFVVWVGWWSPSFAPLGRGPRSRPDLPALWRAWRRQARWGGLVAGLLWVGPVIDVVLGLQNPFLIARSFGRSGARLGLVDGVSLVGRHVRPDGPWMGGAEPRARDYFSVAGSGPFPLLAAVGVLAGCLYLARRYRMADVGAWATLSLTLVAGAIPAAMALPLPAYNYLTEWLKVVGGIVWLTVGWTAWRLVGRAWQATPDRQAAARRAMLVVASLAMIAAVASQWAPAASFEMHLTDEGMEAEALYEELEGELPRDARIRVVRRGERFHIYVATVFYLLARNGYDVVTDEGAPGWKWGRQYRWERGDDYDMLLTVAVDEANDQCRLDPGAQRLAYYDRLTPEEREWLLDARFRRLEGPNELTPEETRRADELGEDDVRLGAYEGRLPCADEEKGEVVRPSDDSAVPLVASGAFVGLVAAGWLLFRRRRGRAGPMVRQGA